MVLLLDDQIVLPLLNIIILTMDQNFHLEELVWAKVKGFPWWPGYISRLDSYNKYEIVFLGDFS